MLRLPKKSILLFVMICFAFVAVFAGTAFAEKKKVIGITCIDLTAATIKRFEQSFTKRANSYGWEVITIDSHGDYDKANASFENFIARGVDGIFNDMLDPNLVANGLRKVKKAGIPVVNGDAGWSNNVVTNVTSNNYLLSTRITTYLLDKMIKDGKKELVSITWPQHHGIRKRTLILHAMLKEYPQIKLLEEHVTTVPGQLEESRNYFANFLNGHPDFKGAVWCAWDEPAAGVTQAVEAAGKEKDIYTTGIDGNMWTFDKYIRKDGPFLATEAQNFELMGFMIADIFKEIFDGKKTVTDYPLNIYVPTLLITKDNCPEEGKYPWEDTGPFLPKYEKLGTWPPY